MKTPEIKPTLRQMMIEFLETLPISDRPICVTVSDESRRMMLVVDCDSDESNPRPRVYSELELSIVKALVSRNCYVGGESSMTSRQIASAIGRRYSLVLQRCLLGLMEREVIRHEHGLGFRLVPTKRTSG